MGIMELLFDDETIHKNYEAELTRNAKKAGEKIGEKNAADLINFLWLNGRGEDAQRASNDSAYLKLLMKEFKSGKLTSST